MRRRLLETALLLAAAGAVGGGVIKYDQSQTGDYNVHLDMKNVDILAFIDDAAPSFGGEYDYDYGELTLKPPAATGSPPNATTEPPASSTAKVDEAAEDAETPVTTPAGTTKPARRCGAGFYRDATGRCRRLRRPGPGIKLSGLLNPAKNRNTKLQE